MMWVVAGFGDKLNAKSFGRFCNPVGQMSYTLPTLVIVIVTGVVVTFNTLSVTGTLITVSATFVRVLSKSLRFFAEDFKRIENVIMIHVQFCE